MPRRKRIVLRLGIGLAILAAVVLITLGANNWSTKRQLEQRLAKLQAEGEPTSFADLAPNPVPAEQDAAVHLGRLAPRLELFQQDQVKFLQKTPLGQSFNKRDERGQPPTPQQIDAIRKILSRYADLAEAIDKASRCEAYASPIDYTVADSLVTEALIPNLSGRRTPARFLRWRILVLLAEGRQEEALEMGMVILRLARLFDREPALVNGLVAIAVRHEAADSLNSALRAGPVSDRVRKQLDQELAFHDDPTWMQQVMKTERAINLSAVRGISSQSWWPPWMARGLEMDTLDYHQRLLPLVSRPWHQSHHEMGSVNTDVSYSTATSRSLMELLTPAIKAAYEAFNRNIATLRCLRIVNQLTAYAQSNGHQAEGLDDLNLTDAATLDPFSGTPLKLKWADKGWVVYSVFKNGRDDGGDFHGEADWGLGPVGHAPY